MRSVALESFGGPEVLSVRELPTPVPLDDQIRVRVDFATVNPTDLLFRKGAQQAALESSEGPWIPGMELAGVVDTVGADCTDSGLVPGDAVVGIVNPRRSEGGAYASFVCLAPSSVAVRPAAIPAQEAATLPMNGLTAIMAIEAIGLDGGASVLVTGAAGALGGYVVQLAHASGLVVIAHGRASDEKTLRELGADHVVAGTEPLADAVHRLFPDGADALVDSAVLGAEAAAAVREGGVMVHVRSASADADPRLEHKVVSVSKRMGNKAALEQVIADAEKGVLTPRVAKVLGMTQAAEAHQLVERGGLRGRIVLDLRPGSDPAPERGDFAHVEATPQQVDRLRRPHTVREVGLVGSSDRSAAPRGGRNAARPPSPPLRTPLTDRAASGRRAESSSSAESGLAVRGGAGAQPGHP